MLNFVYIQRFAESDFLDNERERSVKPVGPDLMLTYTPGKYVIYKFPGTDICTMSTDGGTLVRAFDSEAEARLYAAAWGWDVYVDETDWRQRPQDTDSLRLVF